MPLPVPNWPASTWPTAKSLNLAMWTCDGTLAKPNGILFHARRPMTAEVLDDVLTFSSSSGGTNSIIDQSFAGNHWDATLIVDNAGYYGQTSDGSYPLCAYHLKSVIAGSAGDGVAAGGVCLLCHFVPMTSTGSQVGVGAVMYKNNSFSMSGGKQAASVSHDSTPFLLDLVDTGTSTWSPGVWLADTSSASASVSVNTTDSSGYTPRFFTLWAGVAANQQAAYGTQATPAPYSAYDPSTVIGTTGAATVNLNSASGITGPLNFLSNPPLLRASLASSQSIPNSGPTQVTLNSTADLDSYSGWGAGSTYTVPIPGLYLVHGAVNYSPNGTGSRTAGISVNGTVYWGGAYPGKSTTPCIPAKTQIFDLAAGDTVQLWTQQDATSSVNLGNGDLSRLVLTWLGLRGMPAGSWTPPDLGFRWAAGTTGDQLPALFQQHVGNDLGFLCNRPYMLAYQGSAQTGFANNTTNTVVLGQLRGQIHSSNGDNYNGWTAGVSNHYTAQVAGWYLAVMEVFATAPTLSTSPALTAWLTVSSSGGRTPSSAGDPYQQILPSLNGDIPGAAAVGLYYLQQGETITPQIGVQDWTGGTWGTSISGVSSHMELVWVSE